MIVGEQIIEINGVKEANERVEGLNINISIDDVQERGENIDITYIYNAEYDEDVGDLEIKGVITAQEEEELKNNILETWEEKNQLPEDYAATILRAINYSGSANGTLVARVLGLTAPLIPPEIEISE